MNLKTGFWRLYIVYAACVIVTPIIFGIAFYNEAAAYASRYWSGYPAPTIYAICTAAIVVILALLLPPITAKIVAWVVQGFREQTDK